MIFVLLIFIQTTLADTATDFGIKAYKLCDSLSNDVKNHSLTQKQINEKNKSRAAKHESGYSVLNEKTLATLPEDQKISPASCMRMITAYCNSLNLKDKDGIPQINQKTENGFITMTLVDYTRDIKERRYTIFKINPSDPFKSYPLFHTYATHSGNSDPENTGRPVEFSTISGDNKTSCGAAATRDRYNGAHGDSVRLMGLDEINKNMYSQNKVQHQVGMTMSTVAYGDSPSTNGCIGLGYESPEVHGIPCQPQDQMVKLLNGAVGNRRFYYINCIDERLKKSDLLKTDSANLLNCPLIKNIPTS